MISPAQEREVVKRSPTALEPSQDARPSRFQQLELNGPARRLLHYDCARANPAGANQIADTDFHNVTAAKLAVDCEIK
jgi:hypothetical protein